MSRTTLCRKRRRLSAPLLSAVDFSRAGAQIPVSETSGTPQPPPHSDATTIMVTILEIVVVVMIASVLTNMHAYISAWGDVASKFEIIAKT